MVRFAGRRSEDANTAFGMVKQLEDVMKRSLLRLINVHWKNVKWLRAEDGGEYKGRSFENLITQQGVMH